MQGLLRCRCTGMQGVGGVAGTQLKKCVTEDAKEGMKCCSYAGSTACQVAKAADAFDTSKDCVRGDTSEQASHTLRRSLLRIRK